MTRSKPMTQELKEFVQKNLSYDADTGVIVWLSSVARRVKTGSEAGWVGKRGYRQVNCLGRLMMSHRLAWFLHYGVEPEDQIDHINGVTNDNRITNLRAVTHQENMKNQKQQSNNKSGVTGVRWNKGREKWVAYIKVRGEQKYLGLFEDFFEACCVRKSAEIKYGYSYRHGRIQETRE